MPRFMMFVTLPGDTGEADWQPSAEDVAAMSRYNEELSKAGVLLALDGLHPPEKGARVRFSGGKATVTDGPFTETKELVAGFWILQVRSRDEAVELASRVPTGGHETELEIRRVFDAEDFGDAFSPEQREREQRLRNEIGQS